jgi:hypothetical protein
MAALFLNADLEIESPSPLDSLRDEIGERANNLYCGPVEAGYRAVFEIDEGSEREAREVLIDRFCRLLASLSPSSRLLLSQATRRCIDLGFEAEPTGQHMMQATISSTALAQMHALGIDLALTIYQADPSS